MQMQFRETGLSMPRERQVALQDAQGVRITCRSGLFWITQEGDIRDHVLAPGQVLRISSGGLTVVSALREGEISLQETRAEAPASGCERHETLFRRWLCRLRQSWSSPIPTHA